MSHFYGTAEGNRGQATRCGTKDSGMTTEAAGWGGVIRTHVYVDSTTGEDMYRVELAPWQNSGGTTRVLAEGKLSARESNT